MSRKKEKIRIIKKYSNKENYTFVDSDNILNNTKNNESIMMKISWGSNLMRDLRKRFIQVNYSTKIERF
jgi:hypothetical protein